jgi:hypothetical protein
MSSHIRAISTMKIAASSIRSRLLGIAPLFVLAQQQLPSLLLVARVERIQAHLFALEVDVPALAVGVAAHMNSA